MDNDKESDISKKKPKSHYRAQAFNNERTFVIRSREDSDQRQQSSKPDQSEDHEPDNQSVMPNYLSRLREYRELQRNKPRQRSIVPNQWLPLGPSVLLKGQAGTSPPMSGRVSSIAVAPGGERIYIGSANGGVWRSLDKGETWRPLMESFDLNPQFFASDSLSVGALALVPGDTWETDILYVGSGEANAAHFDSRGGAMFGVGPIISSDGGSNWNTEPVFESSNPMNNLEGSGFFELAVNPNDPSMVIGATLKGLFRREPNPAGGFHWVRLFTPVPLAVPQRMTSVVASVSATGETVFFAASGGIKLPSGDFTGGQIFRSLDNGDSWQIAGADFTEHYGGRICLAVQADNPDVVYAFYNTTIPDGTPVSFEFSRLDVNDGVWRRGRDLDSSFVNNFNGSYNMAVAVSPDNVNTIYLGAGFTQTDSNGAMSTIQGTGSGASLFRVDLEIRSNGTVDSDFPVFIGGSVHPDVHAITFPPGNATEIWIGCDGGVFYAQDPADIEVLSTPRFFFEAKNTGLQTLLMHHMSQHATQEAVIFCGTQDNGCNRFSGEEAWLMSVGGDCGYAIVNWQNPYKVLAAHQFDSSARRPSISRSNRGGRPNTFNRMQIVDPVDPTRQFSFSTQTLFYYPIAGTPVNTGSPNLVALGSVQVWISENFGRDWQSVPSGIPADDELVGPVRSITFASEDLFYVGTHVDQANAETGIYRFTRSGNGFLRERIDRLNFAAGVFNTFPLDASVTDIAIDHGDSTGRSIYITLGGHGDYRHVWYFNGNTWGPRSGSANQFTSLLDIQHSAIVVDPENPDVVYVGADIGVFRSTDGGSNWGVFSEGLPDAAVIDLKIHPGRLLRASTHGRGVFERELNVDGINNVELFIRDTQLDLGRYTTIDGLDDPTRFNVTVIHTDGPDIKIDFPDHNGNYQFDPISPISFVDYMDKLVDDSSVFGRTIQSGDDHIVYAQIHNRGTVPASNVQVMALITHSTVGLPSLPYDYEESIQQGQPIQSTNWETIGIQYLDNVEARIPKIATFRIPSTMLPPPSHNQGNPTYSVLILVHHEEDPFPITPTQTSGPFTYRIIPDTHTICLEQRRAAVKTETHQEIEVGDITAASPTTTSFSFGGSASNHPELKRADIFRLRLVLNGYPWRARLFSSDINIDDKLEKSLKGFVISKNIEEFTQWAKNQLEFLEKIQQGKQPYHKGWVNRQMQAMNQIVEKQLMLETQGKGQEQAIIDDITIPTQESIMFFLMLEPPSEKTKEDKFTIEVFQERKDKKDKYEIVAHQSFNVLSKPTKK